jgi:deferrochelatase/peroxidase EfeB
VRVSRRGLFGTGAGAAVSVGAAAFVSADARQVTATTDHAYDFFGVHQSGIVTPAQDRLHFAAFDVTTKDVDELRLLLAEWTDAAARMMRGESAGEIGATSGDYDAPPDDTGEAIGLDASGLTITFGFGPSLFDDRFGLGDKRPDALVRLPHFPADNLDPARSDGDLCVQACAQDPQVAVHAIRNLARIAMGRAAIRWSQLGFGRTSSTSVSQDTPRNLFGFKDGTMNVKAEETDALDEHVWVGDGWLAGGSYLIARRINMTIETWDRQSLREQELVIGRSKAEGAPLSGGEEFTEPDFALTGREGLPLVDPTSHVAMAHPDNNGGVRMLRRGYNFVDGTNALGRLDAGLFFLAYVADPATHYIPMQTAMARTDRLSEYLQHTGSALFACPPGVRRPGGSIGDALFA